MTTTQNAKQATLTDDDVAEFLRDHPEFFIERPALLAEIELPHTGGKGTTSLIERQVSILRERNIAMRQRVDQLLHTARRNDQLFEKTRKLTLDLVQGNSIDSLVDALFSSFDQDFAIEQTQLILLSDNPQQTTNERTRYMSADTLQDAIPSLSSKLKIFCGQLTDKEKHLLFQDSDEDVQSAAVVPLLAGKERLGLLAIGNKDAQYYRSSMDTLFLSHIADIFSQCLLECLMPENIK